MPFLSTSVSSPKPSAHKNTSGNIRLKLLCGNWTESAVTGLDQLLLHKWLELVLHSHLPHQTWLCLPTTLSELLLASPMSKIKPRAQQPETTPTPLPLI